MVPPMLPLILCIALIFSSQQVASAADDCADQACINVYTDNNQIIIEARKGKTTVKKRISQAPKKVAPRPTAKPQATRPPVFLPPQLVTKPKAKKPAVKRTYKPRVKKAATKINLSDRLTKIVPPAGIAYQPEFEPLAQVPVYFWVDVPTYFQSRVNIIGEVVDVALRPSFTWSFGDGSVFMTTDIGAPYPLGRIQHSYSKPGNYLVTVVTTWNGSYTHNAQARAVSGKVINVANSVITVVAAPTHFTHK